MKEDRIMSKKLLYLMCFVVVLGLVGNASAQLDPALIEAGHVYLFEDVNGTNVPDDSANINTGAILGDPLIVEGLYGKALQLDGVDDGVHLPDAPGINTSTHTDHTVVAIFNCVDVNKPEHQCVYEEGGSTRGLTIYVHEGMVYAGGWDKSDYTPEWEGTFLSAPINSNEWVAVIAVLRDAGPGQEDDKFEMWMDGELIGVGPGGQLQSRSDDNGVGTVIGQTIFHDMIADAGHWFEGMVDEVWILNDPMSEGALDVLMGLSVGEPLFLNPSDGSEVAETTAVLGWRPGDFATSHTVYMGTDMDAVAAGTVPAIDAPLGSITAGAADGPIPDGLEPGNTYYWRVEAVNDVNPESPWTSEVMSLWLLPFEAMEPSPADGAKFAGPAVTLSWTPGFGATEHTVYIGDDFGAVSSATGGVPQTETTYDAGVLEKGTMYHWRVDEFDGTTTHKGDVWSFETPTNIPITDPNLIGWWKMDNEGFGVAVVDSSGYDHHATIHGDPQWIDGYGGGALDFNGSSDYLSLDGYKGILGPNPFSITAWINTSSNSGTLMGWGSTAGGTTRFEFRPDADELRAESSGNVQGLTKLSDNEWIHVAVTVKADAIITEPDVTLYLNGQVDNDPSTGGTAPLDMAPGYDVTIARRHTSGRFFDVLIDDLRLYNKELSADEVKQTMRIDLAQAWDPQPGNLKDTPIWTALSWQAGDGAVEHDIYLAADLAAVVAADASDATGIYLGRQAETMIVPAGLAWTTRYFWRVDEVAEDGAITAGLIWSFTTTDEIVLYDEVTPFPYDNSADPFLSEIALDLDPAQDWTGGCGGGIGAVSVSYDGLAGPGSLTEADGIYTLVGRGMGAWNQSDEIQYAHTTLAGDGSMIVKVESLDAPHDFTRVGVMIRESLDPGSAHASVYVSSANGVLFQSRATTGQATVDDSSPIAEAVAAPVWLKIERSFPMISAYYSTDGETWLPATLTPQVIPMTPLPIHIGLVVAANSPDSATAVFSNVSSTGGVAAGSLNFAEIGLESNSAEPMYMVLEDASGATSAALNPVPEATQLVGAEWIIDLDEYSIDRAAVVKATLVVGDLDNPTAGGTGTLTINSVKLLPDCVPVGHWTLDETDGTVAADSSRTGGNDGVLNGAAMAWASGKVGGALSFDGAASGTDYVEISTTGISTAAGTIALWGQLAPEPQAPETRYFYGHTTLPAWQNRIQLYMDASDTVLDLGLGDSHNRHKDIEVLETETWYHLALTWDGGNYAVYVNGAELATGEYAGLDTLNTVMDIGNDGNADGRTEMFNGLLDDVRIYDVALPAAEIAKLAGM